MIIKLFDLEDLPRSTRYFYKARIDYFMMTVVWSAWKKAKGNNADIPTMDSIWGTVDFSAFIFEDTRTGEIRVSQERPSGSTWQNYGEVAGASRESTINLLSGVNLTGMAVDRVFRDCLSNRQMIEILQLLPVTGKYRGEVWDSEQFSGKLTDARSIRDLSVRHVDPTELNMTTRLSHVVASKAVQAGVRVLSVTAAVVPPKLRAQLPLMRVEPTIATPGYAECHELEESDRPKSDLSSFAR